MTEPVPPSAALPSTRTLLRSTALAAVVATALLLTAVLPAEYGIDPTGVGRLIGLTEMGETKGALAQEAKIVVAPPSPALPCTPVPTVVPPTPAGSGAAPVRAQPSDVTQVTLQPGEGKEVKLTMRESARVTFSWSTDKGVVNYDLHSDNPTTGAYHGYDKGKGLSTHEGVLVAAFDGKHGWFWRNRTREAVTITLKTVGDYQEVQEVE